MKAPKGRFEAESEFFIADSTTEAVHDGYEPHVEP